MTIWLQISPGFKAKAPTASPPDPARKRPKLGSDFEPKALRDGAMEASVELEVMCRMTGLELDVFVKFMLDEGPWDDPRLVVEPPEKRPRADRLMEEMLSFFFEDWDAEADSFRMESVCGCGWRALVEWARRGDAVVGLGVAEAVDFEPEESGLASSSADGALATVGVWARLKKSGLEKDGTRDLTGVWSWWSGCLEEWVM